MLKKMVMQTNNKQVYEKKISGKHNDYKEEIYFNHIYNAYVDLS